MKTRTWLLILGSWYLIGYLFTDWQVAFALLVVPAAISLASGLILARIKHHNLEEFIAHDIQETAIAVTSGALAFTLTFVIITLALPASGSIALTTTYYLLAIPAGLALALTTYTVAKRYAQHRPNLRGAASAAAAALLIVLLGGFVFSTTLDAETTSVSHYITSLPDSQTPVLADIAAMHNEISAWQVQSDLSRYPARNVRNVHEAMKNLLSNMMQDNYIKAQKYLLEGAAHNVTAQNITSNPCWPLQETSTPPQFFTKPDSLGEYFMHRAAKASDLDEMVQETHQVIEQTQQKQKQFYTRLFEGAQSDNNTASRTTRYLLVHSHLQESSC